MPENDAEARLVRAAKGGDAEAFGVIVKTHMPRALAFARSMAGDSDDAQDLVQDAFVKAYRSLGGFRGSSSFYTWFARILANVCIDHIRKRAVLRRLFFFAAPRENDNGSGGGYPPETGRDDSPGAMPDRSAESGELGRAIGRAVGRLPGRQRAVFLLRHNDGMRLSGIAAVLGISEGAVKSHLSRAAASLRKQLKEHEGDV